MELEVHMLVPYLLASVYFIFQDWFQNIALKWYGIAIIAIVTICWIFSIRVHLNIIQIGAELIQIILAYLLLTRKFSKLTTFGLIMIIGIVTTVAIFLLIRGKIIKDNNKLRKVILSLFFRLKNYDIIST